MPAAFGPFASPLSAARAVAILVPSVLIFGALGFEHLGGYAPCEMCYWQRWPHLAAIALALIAIALRGSLSVSRTATGFAALAILASGLIGLFHAGVEYGWWEGLTACSTGAMEGNALEAIMATPLVRCDAPAWTLFGVSMAGYNALISTSSAALIGLLLITKRGPTA